ncbi:MAG TPA: flagellar basal body L-ring protein FlgH [Steroidobacteraceae bacterium]|nr:flagellar basal body L-ring protein FlgH [Steroidobacteraceae bacterium]
MQKLKTILCAGLALAGVSACRTSHPSKQDDGLAWTQEKPAPPTEGAIYRADHELELASNPIARHVGDIVTIMLEEQTAAQKSATTDTNKATTDTLPGPTLLGKAVTFHGTPILNNSIDNSTKFTGEGDSAQSNSLTGYLAVTVIKVLPNGYLLVSGQKQIGLNQGQEYIRLTGVIRPIDLASDDSVPSYRVANAHISYSGKGAINDANAMSWLTRFFNSPWAPF